jgi:hypothetical protein
MPTNFPTSVDNFTNPTANDSLNIPSHSLQHSNANDAIEAIETSLFAGGINNVGLVHISTQVGTASITSFNNVFTTAYTNYRIILSMTGTSSASSPLYMRLRAGGSDNTTSSYKYALSNLSTTGTVNTSQSNGTDVFLLTFISNTSGNISVAMDLMLPQVNTRTLGTFQLMGFDGGNFYVRNSGIQHDAVAQFDGFSILTGSAATIDSTISVYGYRKA